MGFKAIGQSMPVPGTPSYEDWMRNQISSVADSADTAIKLIPVIVHVLHGGEAIGVGPNISDAVIASQIRILNEDYGRLAGTNGYNTNAAGVDTRIRFVLANRDPYNQPTTGIHRVTALNARDTTSTWNFNDGRAIKRFGYWPCERYMNIWVCNMTDNTLGFAQYPVTTLPGLTNIGPQLDSTDGVVIGYKFFGASGALGGKYNLGRSATHEIGHFFGLVHAFGDAPCGNDYCEDTPPQANESYHCPIGQSTCNHPGVPDMIENYMNYTDDHCMSIFTFDQWSRMKVVLANSRCRKTLYNSGGYVDPTGVNPNIEASNIKVQPIDGLDGNFLLTFPGDTNYPVRLTLFDIAGRRVDEKLFSNAGGTTVQYTLNAASAGIYMAVFNFNGFKVLRRLPKVLD
ncbi:MAG: zinc metalloprotease [Bacteroidota bacterium]